MHLPLPPRTVALLLIVLLACFWFARREGNLRNPGGTVIHFLAIGQGDSAMIISPSGKQIIIDGGRDLNPLEAIGARMPFFDKTIDLLVLTHPQLDHIGAFPEILRRYRVNAVLMTGVAYDLSRYDEFLALLKKEGARVMIADPAHDIDFGDGLTFDVLWPHAGLYGKTPKGDVNDTSIVLKACYSGSCALFTGDMEEPAEKEMLKEGINVDADILKVGHHGSRTSSGTGFLLAVSPDLAVISLSATNSYGHPHPWVMRRFATLKIPVRQTAQEGTVTVRLGR